MAKNTPPGPAVDASGQTVIDPTDNVRHEIRSEAKAQNALREIESKHVREIMKIRDKNMRRAVKAEAKRLNEIRKVADLAVQEVARVADVRATALQAQVVQSAETVRQGQEVDRERARVALVSATAPIAESVTALQQQQYLTAGGKTQSQEAGISSRAWIAIAIAASVLGVGFMGFVVTVIGLGVTIYFATRP